MVSEILPGGPLLRRAGQLLLGAIPGRKTG
jgi:hypothetical protein